MHGKHGMLGGPWEHRSRGGDGGSSWRHGGPPPWVAGLFGGPQPGDVRAAILDVLSVEPMNGYQIINQIAQRTGGAWKPSPGSVYPTIQQLEDEGLVEGISTNGRRENELTEAGRTYVEEHPDELAATWRPFDEAADENDSPPGLKPAIGQMMSAVWQVASTGSPQQQAQAAEILADTRRRLYGLLADGDPES